MCITSMIALLQDEKESCGANPQIIAPLQIQENRQTTNGLNKKAWEEGVSTETRSLGLPEGTSSTKKKKKKKENRNPEFQ